MTSPINITAANALAAKLLDREPGWGTGKAREARAQALGHVLATTPPGGEHGQLLKAALTPTTGPRPAPERAFRAVLRSCKAPTERAVAAELVAVLAVDAAPPDQGARAARIVADHRLEHGHGPTWSQLAAEMGWPSRFVAQRHIEALRASGWLRTGKAPHSLQPGRAANLIPAGASA